MYSIRACTNVQAKTDSKKNCRIVVIDWKKGEGKNMHFNDDMIIMITIKTI